VTDFVCDVDRGYRSACKGLDYYDEHEGKRYCVLHFPGEVKTDAFEKAVQSKLAGHDYDFRGTVFPEGASNFLGFVFDANADFTGATFFGGANFGGAKFSGEQTDFLYAMFSGENTNFSNAIFSGKTVHFSDAKFNSEKTHFKDAEFGVTAAGFSGAEFSGRADFLRVKFSGEKTYFKSVKFRGEGTYFGAAKFGGKETHFLRAEFSSKETYFSSAEFSGRADFEDVTFCNAAFEEATFKEMVRFDRVIFKKAANMQKATFYGEAHFPDATFKEMARFDEATFKERVAFYNLVTSSNTTLDFSKATIEKPERVYFHNSNLHPSWFVDVDSRKFNFTNVNWYGLAGGPDGSLEDETKALQDRTIESPHLVLAQACRRLSANAEDNREYPLANEFHYWSMDAARKGDWNFFKDLTWRDLLKRESWPGIARHFGLITTLYWALSGYGVRATRAFWVLVGLWLTFAVLYMVLGHAELRVFSASSWWFLKAATSQPTLLLSTFSAFLGYSYLEVFPVSSFGEAISHCAHALMYSLGVMARLRPEPIPNEMGLFQILVTIEGILGPLQIALLALAIRRKVMR
jgi:uncharacterized protein YjbI with pentapeptide repeats